MTYISKFQQRNQTVACCKISSLQSIERYDMFYDLVYEGILKNAFPLIRLRYGQLLIRKANAKDETQEKDPNAPRWNIEQSRQIPPHAALSSSNRYSGIRLDGKPGQGVLYTATLAAGIREYAHYELTARNRKLEESNIPYNKIIMRGRPDDTRNHMRNLKQKFSGTTNIEAFPYHVYKLVKPLTFADIRSPALTSIMARAKPAVTDNQHFSNQNRVMSVYEGNDYSAGRGIADAVYDAGAKKGIQGVCAESARTDTDMNMYLTNHGDTTGGLNVAIFGKPGATIMALHSIKSFPDFKSMLEFVQPGPKTRPPIYTGS